MARHRITTTSLLHDIDRQRVDEAAARWDELSRKFMNDDALEESDADSEQRVR